MLAVLLFVHESAIWFQGKWRSLAWWTGGGEEEGLAAIYEVFKAKYPDVEIIKRDGRRRRRHKRKSSFEDTECLAAILLTHFQVHGGMEQSTPT